MNFELLYVIFIVLLLLNYILLDIKVDMMKKENRAFKEKLLYSLKVSDKALLKLNEGFKDHERRINDIKDYLSDEDMLLEIKL